MTKLPVVSGRECAEPLTRVGFEFKRRQGTSHMIYRHESTKTTISIPDHKELDRGLLRSIIRQAGLTVDEFVELLD